MATAKSTEVETTVTVEEDPWKIMKPVHIPRPRQGEEKSLFVAINGHTFNIPKGKMEMVPAPVYDVVMEHLENLDVEQSVVDGIPNQG